MAELDTVGLDEKRHSFERADPLVTRQLSASDDVI